MSCSRRRFLLPSFLAAAGVNHKDAGSAFGVFLINDDDAGGDASTIEEVGGQAYEYRNPLLFRICLADSFLGIASEQNAVWHNQMPALPVRLSDFRTWRNHA